MNRRTLLRSAGVVGVAGTAGCLEAVLGDRELRRPVQLLFENVGSESYYLRVVAARHDTGETTYEKSFAISPGERVQQSPLDGVAQEVRVVRRDGVRALADVTENARTVSVTVGDDEITIDVRNRDEG